MWITDQTTERLRAESRLRTLTTGDLSASAPASPPASPSARPPVSGGAVRSSGSDGPGEPAGLRSTPAPPFLEGLRAAVARRGPALGPTRPGLRVLFLVALLAAVVGGVHAWRSQPEPEPVASPTPVSGSLSPMPVSGPPSRPTALAADPAAGGAGEVTVHVTGKVRRAGVITLPTGSRIADALRAAGGVRSGARAGPLNLARRLVDGEQIVVGLSAHAVAAASTFADPATAVLDLNTATPLQLERLPGVGEVLARRIAEYRDAHGGFRSVEQLREVTGIGERKYAEMKDRVRA